MLLRGLPAATLHGRRRACGHRREKDTVTSRCPPRSARRRPLLRTSPHEQTWYDASRSLPPPQEILSPASRIRPIGGHQHRRRCLPPRDAPHCVDRAPSSIPLKDKNTRAFGIRRVVFNHDRGLDTIDHLTGKDTVLGDLIVAVRGDPNLAGSNEIDDPNKRLAHLLVASVTSGPSRAN